MSEYSAPLQFIDLASQQAKIRPKIDAAIARVLDHGQYIMGPEVKQFENDLKAFTGSNHALSCANGTDALTLVMMAWGIGPVMQFLCRVLPMSRQPKHLRSWEQRLSLLMCWKIVLILILPALR